MGSPRPSLRSAATVTSKGQVTIPKPIRKALGITTGSQLEFQLTSEGRAILTTGTREVSDLFTLLPARPRRKRMSLSAMEAAIRSRAVR